MARVNLPYINSYRDRYGTWRFCYRRGKTKIKLPKDPSSPEFMAEYQRINQMFSVTDSGEPAIGTFGHLVSMYYSAPEFKELKDKTKKDYRYYLDAAKAKFRDVPLKGMTRKVIKIYRDKMAEKPVAANYALRVLRRLFSYAKDLEMIKDNPADGIKQLKNKSKKGWEAWDDEALHLFAGQSKGPSRIAFYLALYTGQRQADVLQMRWDAIRDDGIQVVQNKNGAALWIPIHPTLAKEIEHYRRTQNERTAARSQKKQPASFGLTIVQKENGAPYKEQGFTSIWGREKKRLGCTYTFHGLRKNATNALYEAGCTPQQVQAITGHATLQMVQHYGKGANQKRLAKEAMRLVVLNDTLPK